MDKVALAKAIIICGLSWAAVPVLYYMLKKREKKENGSKNEKNSMGKEVVEAENTSSRSG